jgi:hypothetical protein
LEKDKLYETVCSKIYQNKIIEKTNLANLELKELQREI